MKTELEEKLKVQKLCHHRYKIFEPLIDQQKKGSEQLKTAKITANGDLGKIILKRTDFCEVENIVEK